MSSFHLPNAFRGIFWRSLLYFIFCLFAVVSADCSTGSSSITDHVTTNRIYRDFTAKDSLSCALECYHDDFCASYNYEYNTEHSSGHICQLSRCGSNGILMRPRFWFHQLRPSKIEDVCKTHENSSNVCKERPLGMESGAIPDSSITASSIYSSGYAAHRARLNLKRVGEPAAWAAKAKAVGEWIQVDLSKVMNVTGVATQGSKNETEWVTSYMLKYSDDGKSYKDYQAGKTLSGNKDIDKVVKHDLKPAIYARYIKLFPLTWYGHPSLRMELYGCI